MGFDGLDQHGKGRLSSQTAGLLERKDSLYPTVALFTGGPLAALAPQYPKAQCPLGRVIGRLHPFDLQEHPKGVYLPQKTSGEFARLILAVMVFGDEAAEPGIKGPPFPYGRLVLGHVAKPLELGQSLGAKGRDLRAGPLGEGPGLADQMAQAGLPELHPVLVNPIAIADQNPYPVFDQGSKGLLGPVGMDHEKGHRSVDHSP